MSRRIHFAAGVAAALTIGTFFLTTAVVELFGSHEAVVTVKRLILLPGLVVLVPMIALASGTGFRRSRSSNDPRIADKKKRMPFIAANGLLFLIPCAIVLERLAVAGRIDGTFYAVQIVELVAGAMNFLLMSLNVRDGIRMSGRFRTQGA